MKFKRVSSIALALIKVVIAGTIRLINESVQDMI